MSAKTIATTTIGAAIALLGLLWFLQGADLIHIRPILCVADCEPLVGGSVGWMIAGVIGIVVGSLIIRLGAKRTRSA
jgi:hypothetical protein